MKAFIINLENISLEKHFSEYTDFEFADLAKKHGMVESLEKFANKVNKYSLGENIVIRFMQEESPKELRVVNEFYIKANKSISVVEITQGEKSMTQYTYNEEGLKWYCFDSFSDIFLYFTFDGFERIQLSNLKMFDSEEELDQHLLSIPFPEKKPIKEVSLQNPVTEYFFEGDFMEWAETHYEICVELNRCAEDPNNEDSFAAKVRYNEGIGGLYELSINLTNKFMSLYDGRDWDGDYMDTLEEFLKMQMQKEWTV